MFTLSGTSAYYHTSEFLSSYSADVQQQPVYPSSAPYSALSLESAPSSAAPLRHQAARLLEPENLKVGGLILRGHITHPYSHLYRKKQDEKSRKIRKMWNLNLEKKLFTPEEISKMSAPDRRKIYTASLEAHINCLHDQLASHSLAVIPPEALRQYEGLNIKTAKSMVSGLQHDLTELELKILEVERANEALEQQLGFRSKGQL